MEDELQASMEMAFQVYIRTLDMVTLLKYLGQVLTASDGNWSVLVSDIQKARNTWARFSSIWGW